MNNFFLFLLPWRFDVYRPFPMLLSKSLNLAIVLEEKEIERTNPFPFKGKLGIVQVPSVIDRFIELTSKGGERVFVLIEEVISHFIYKLFRGQIIHSITPFHITRNADLAIHEDGADDLLQEIEEELKKRKWGASVRLEVQYHCYDKQVVKGTRNSLQRCLFY